MACRWTSVVCCGGIAEKNKLLMQIYADVIGSKIEIAGSSQAVRPRLGGGRYGARGEEALAATIHFPRRRRG